MTGKKIIRNILLVLVSIALIIGCVEFLLGRGGAQNDENTEEYVLQQNENEKILKMQMERTGYADLFASTVFGNIVSGLIPPTPEEKMTVEKYCGYPLIDYLRDDADSDEDPVNIVVIGDSFVFGEYCLNRNELFWRVAENDLRAEGFNVRISGVAMIGANSFDELRWLTGSTLIDDLKPDLIVIGYLYNDPDTSSTDKEILNNADFVDGRKNRAVAAISKILPNIGKRLANYVTAKTMYTSDGNYLNIDTLPPILKGEIYDNFKNNFIEPLDRFSAEKQIPTVIMTLPVYEGKMIQKALYRPLHTLCASCKNIALYDSLGDFYGKFVSSKHNANYSVNCADFHPGSATNSFYAQYLETFLKRDYADILGKSIGTAAAGGEMRINEALPSLSSPQNVAYDSGSLTCEVEYPSKKANHEFCRMTIRQNYLTMLLKKDFITLSFAAPTALSDVVLTGDDTTGIELSYMCINEKLGYDDHTVYTPEKENGTWKFEPDKRVTTLLIHADCENNDGARLTLRIRPA
ncbi:MAG: SGNH/GDSL hydrolase family protein [Clostridia bacterium]|nr:SGNH/GDSL hydrolase family protein [Clostridia bacterium]